MTEAQRFWQQVDADQRDGVLLVVLFKTWKRIADQLGMQAVDIGSSVFEAICRLATEGALAGARISTTVFAAYWPYAGSQEKATDFLARWLPIDVSSAEAAISVECDWRVLDRPQGEIGRELYGRTRLEVGALVEALPEQERYPALPMSWDEVANS
jgi:hypothetical protein